MVKCIILKINVVVMMRDCAVFFFFLFQDRKSGREVRIREYKDWE